jgi:hypothetical protein
MGFFVVIFLGDAFQARAALGSLCLVDGDVF